MKSLAIVLALIAGCGAPQRPVAAQLPAEARLLDPDNAPFVAADRYRGKILVLDFWASWCDECKRSVPQVGRLAAAFAGDGLVVLGVNAGEAGAEATRSARELGIAYPIALDPELAFSDRLGASRLPVLLVVDRAGAIVHRTRRVDAETLSIIRALLAAPR